MSEQMEEFSAAHGYAYIEARLSACFSSEELITEIKFGESKSAHVNLNRDGLMQTTFIDRQAAEDFLRRVLEAAHKPEVLAGTRMTTWYHVILRWKNLSLGEYPVFGQVEFKGNELPTEELEKLLPGLKGQAGEKLKSLLEKGLHCRALEIYRLVSEFTKSNAYLKRIE